MSGGLRLGKALRGAGLRSCNTGIGILFASKVRTAQGAVKLKSFYPALAVRRSSAVAPAPGVDQPHIPANAVVREALKGLELRDNVKAVERVGAIVVIVTRVGAGFRPDSP